MLTNTPPAVLSEEAWFTDTTVLPDALEVLGRFGFSLAKAIRTAVEAELIRVCGGWGEGNVFHDVPPGPGALESIFEIKDIGRRDYPNGTRWKISAYIRKEGSPMSDRTLQRMIAFAEDVYPDEWKSAEECIRRTEDCLRQELWWEMLTCPVYPTEQEEWDMSAALPASLWMDGRQPVPSAVVS